MVHPYVVNSINASVLIIAGLIGYFANPANPPTALIAPALGVLLLACTQNLRKHNRFVFNTVTALTLLFAVVTLFGLEPDRFIWDASHIIALVMGFSSLIAVFFFISSFVRERRLRNQSIYKDDL